MAISSYLPRDAQHPGKIRHVRVFGQYEAGNRWLELQVDESGRLKMGSGSASLGAVKIEDQDSSVRADVSPTGSLFGNGLHTLAFVDPTGRARPAALDNQGRVLLSNVDIEIGAVELKNFDTDVRAEISVPGSGFGPALHTMPGIDSTGNARPLLVDNLSRLEIGGSNVTELIDNTQDAADSLAAIDDWDQNDRAKTSPIPGQDGVAADAGASDVLTQRVISASDSPEVTALEIIDDWDAMHDAAYSTDGPQVMGAYDAVASAVDNGDAARLRTDAYGQLIGTSDNLALGARQTLEQSPWVYDFLGNTLKSSAALPGAGAYDTPTEIPLGGRRYVKIWCEYTRGGAGGSFRLKIETAATISGTDEWAEEGVTNTGAFVAGANTNSQFQIERFSYQATGAAQETCAIWFDVGRASKIRIPARELGAVGTPGTLAIYYMFYN